MTAYDDLEICIDPHDVAGYRVAFRLNTTERHGEGTLSAGLPNSDGKALSDWFFGGDGVLPVWEEMRHVHPQRRIRLWLPDGDPALHALPWEALCAPDSGTPLAASDATPFSRYPAEHGTQGTPLLAKPLRVLVAVAATQDAPNHLTPLDADAELAALREATEGLDVELVPLDGSCSLVAIQAALRDGGYHALHLIAHGSARLIAHGSARTHGEVDDTRGETVLYLAGADNWATPVPGNEFAAMLREHLGGGSATGADSLHLVFLSSCRGLARGLGHDLIGAGVPAVVGMRADVARTAAQAFSGTFYRQLLHHGLVDLASNQARATVGVKDLPDADVPVLLMRLHEGRLFEQEGQILGEETGGFWETLLENITEGLCTPFLGSGVTAGWLPSTQELAQSLARQYNYPFVNCGNLLCVGQFVGTLDNRRLRRDVLRYMAEGFATRMELSLDAHTLRCKSLAQVIEESGWGGWLRESGEGEIFGQLADLGLPVYLTTNYDNLMTLALQALPLQNSRRTPRRLVVGWQEPEKSQEERPHWSLDQPASPESPVVLHLFGTDVDPLSMVLTEDDHLDYLARIARDYEFLLPSGVQAALASTTLLFLGYRLEDLDFKVIMRGLLTNLDLEKWGMLHVAVQLEAPPENVAQQQDVIRYFQKYFANARIDVYWGSTRQFMADLYVRWKARGHSDG